MLAQTAMCSSHAFLRMKCDLLVSHAFYRSKSASAPSGEAQKWTLIVKMHIKLQSPFRACIYVSSSTCRSDRENTYQSELRDHILTLFRTWRGTLTDKTHMKLHGRFCMQIYIWSVTCHFDCETHIKVNLVTPFPPFPGLRGPLR